MQDRAASRPRGRPRHPDVLTPAEWRVLEHVRAGLTNPEIAVRLGVSVDTVKYHVSNMLAKLELEDRRDLALWQPETGRRMWSAGLVLAAIRRHLGGLSRATEGRRGAVLLGGGAVLLAVALTIGLLLALNGDDEPSTPGMLTGSSSPSVPAGASSDGDLAPPLAVQEADRDGGPGLIRIITEDPQAWATRVGTEPVGPAFWFFFDLQLPREVEGGVLHGWSGDGSALILAVPEAEDDVGPLYDIYRLPVTKVDISWVADRPQRITSLPSSEEILGIAPGTGYIAYDLRDQGCPLRPERDNEAPCPQRFHIINEDAAVIWKAPSPETAFGAWMPDGEGFLYVRPASPETTGTAYELVLASVRGTEQVLIPWADLDARGLAVSPAGNWLAFRAWAELGRVVVLNLSGASLNVSMPDGVVPGDLVWRDESRLWILGREGDPEGGRPAGVFELELLDPLQAEATASLLPDVPAPYAMAASAGGRWAALALDEDEDGADLRIEGLKSVSLGWNAFVQRMFWPPTPLAAEEQRPPLSGTPDEEATALPSATKGPEPTAEPKTRILAFSNHFCWYCDGGSGTPHIMEIHPDQTATVFELALPDWLGGPMLHGWSPDGAALIVSGFAGDDLSGDAYRVPVERGPSGWTAGAPVNLTQSPESEGWVLVDQARGRMAVRVFPEGCLAYAVDDPCDGVLHVLEPDGTRGPVIADNGYPSAWSPDGRWLLYVVPSASSNELWLLDTETMATELVPRPPGVPYWHTAAFSPDGDQFAVAYSSSTEVGDIAVFSRDLLTAEAFMESDGRLTFPEWRGESELWGIDVRDPTDPENPGWLVVKADVPPEYSGLASLLPESVPAIDSVWEISWSPDGQVLAAGLYRLGAFADGRMVSPVTYLSFDGGQTFLRVGIGPDADYFWRPEPDP